MREECPLCSHLRHKRRRHPKAGNYFADLPTKHAKTKVMVVVGNDHHYSTQCFQSIISVFPAATRNPAAPFSSAERASADSPRHVCATSPNTPLGQALIRQMISSGGIPHLTHSGDIIVVDAAPAGGVKALKLVPKLKL